MKAFIQLVALLVLGIAPLQQTQATLFTTALDFEAQNQSFWGAGSSSASFGSSGSWGLGPFDFSYDIGASTGTVSAQFGGNLLVDYAPTVYRYNAPSLDLNFLGDIGGGQIKSDLGAWANARALGFDILDFDYGLNINQNFTPQIDTKVSASDSDTIAGKEVNVIVAKIGVNFDIEQTDNFEVNSIDGLLGYSLRGSGVANSTPFSLDNSAGLSIDLGLDAVGVWDIWFMDMTVDNTFSTLFDASLVLYEEHIDGIKICKKCKWGICIKIPCGIDYDRNETELASINVYDGDPFSLNFNSISNTITSGFSIRVVPEPPVILLLLIGVLGLNKYRLK